MKSFFKVCSGLFLILFISIWFCLETVSAQQLLITTDIHIESNQSSVDSKKIDDLLGPDTNFPFDPANHRDGSNPLKRIGSISDDNL